MADFFDIFQLNRNNIISWTKDYIQFFRSPRKYIDILTQRSGEDLIPQFIFYFLAYTFSHILFISLPFNELIKPALFNLTHSIVSITFLTITTYLITRKNYFVKILIFVLSTTLFLSPISIFLFSLFLANEEYLIRLILTITTSAITLFLLFGYAFVIEIKWGKALKICLLNYLLLNLFVLTMTRLNFDKYGGIVDINSIDPIYDEYKMLFESLVEKEKIPTSRLFTVLNGELTSITISVQDIINDSASKGGTNVTLNFRKHIELNIDTLKKILPQLKFKRNIQNCNDWINYFGLIHNQINLSIKDTAELFAISNLKEIFRNDTTGLSAYYSQIPIKDSILSLQIHLKEYHNNIVFCTRTCDIPTQFLNLIQYFPSELMDSLIYLIRDEGKPYQYKEKFKSLTRDKIQTN